MRESLKRLLAELFFASLLVILIGLLVYMCFGFIGHIYFFHFLDVELCFFVGFFIGCPFGSSLGVFWGHRRISGPPKAGLVRVILGTIFGFLTLRFIGIIILDTGVGFWVLLILIVSSSWCGFYFIPMVVKSFRQK